MIIIKRAYYYYRILSPEYLFIPDTISRDNVLGPRLSRKSFGRLIEFSSSLVGHHRLYHSYKPRCFLKSGRLCGEGHSSVFVLSYCFPIPGFGNMNILHHHCLLCGTLAAGRRSKFCRWISRASRASQLRCRWSVSKINISIVRCFVQEVHAQFDQEFVKSWNSVYTMIRGECK